VCDKLYSFFSSASLPVGTVNSLSNTKGNGTMIGLGVANHELCHHIDDVTQHERQRHDDRPGCNAAPCTAVIAAYLVVAMKMFYGLDGVRCSHPPPSSLATNRLALILLRRQGSPMMIMLHRLDAAWCSRVSVSGCSALKYPAVTPTYAQSNNTPLVFSPPYQCKYHPC
jgi:hypothetical protein